MTALSVRESEARAALESLYEQLRTAGCAAPESAEGHLIRPLLSLAGAAGLSLEFGGPEWAAIAAVQLAHEASLVHDDVIDNATHRRACPTVFAEGGLVRALVEGDHLLTTAYRVAAASGSVTFMTSFAHAVERTVAGEKLQTQLSGSMVDEQSYRRVVGMKSGELIGCALAAVAHVQQHGAAAELYVLGRRVGTLYQMLDDLLDYCPDTDTGKPALGDYRQGRWTWPLLELPGVSFGLEPEAVATLLSGDGDAASPIRRCLARLEQEADGVRAALATMLPGDSLARELVDGWLRRAAAAVETAGGAHLQRRSRQAIEAHVQTAAATGAFFRQNSRTFSFAARLFPPDFRKRTSRIYAFCRLTDDLADSDAPLDPEERRRRLDLWEALAREAYAGVPSGIAILDRVMQDAAAAGIPFNYVEELIAGMRMDLEGTRYESLAELRLYSFRVAGVIGQWMTRMCGIGDPWMLERAASLGHAMQLTNILRDVGEDLGRGRLYLPADVMADFGVTEDALHKAAAGHALPPAWSALMESLMDRSDQDYAAAMEAVPRLPPYFRHAIVVAAHVYRGIHDEIRRNGYNNLRMRARTGPATKMRLALSALAGAALRPRASLHRLAPPAPSATPPPAMRLTHRNEAELSAPRAVDKDALRHRAGAALLVLVLLFPFPVVGAAVAGSSGSTAETAAYGAGLIPQAVATIMTNADLRSPADYVRQLEAAHAAHPADPAIMLDLARAHFFLGVDQSRSVARGSALIQRLRQDAPAFAARHATLLSAYEGAFTMLEAKHGNSPPSRFNAVRSGLRTLDDAVASAPEDIEIRYLRLVNTHYLPDLFGRRGTARQDMAVLRRLMHDGAGNLHPALRPVIAEFLRNYGA